MDDLDHDAAVMCALDHHGASSRLAEWAGLRSHLRRSERSPSGARAWLDSEVASEVSALAAREADCCAFLSLRVERAGDDVVLDISAGSPDGVAVAHLLLDLVQTGSEAGSAHG